MLTRPSLASGPGRGLGFAAIQDGRAIISLGVGGAGVRSLDHTLTRLGERVQAAGWEKECFWREGTEGGERVPRAVYVGHEPTGGMRRTGAAARRPGPNPEREHTS